MIAFLQGKVVEALPTQVIIEVNGVGYDALIPLSSFDKLPPPGQPVKLLTHVAIREDAHGRTPGPRFVAFSRPATIL